MSIKILIDMNLPPRWVEYFRNSELESVHWSAVGKFDASDKEIMAYAKNNGYVVFTHDLDFGAILAATNAEGPSVIQVRSDNVLPEATGEAVICLLRDYQASLQEGSLITLDHSSFRLRILPLKR